MWLSVSKLSINNKHYRSGLTCVFANGIIRNFGKKLVIVPKIKIINSWLTNGDVTSTWRRWKYIDFTQHVVLIGNVPKTIDIQCGLFLFTDHKNHSAMYNALRD
jgi:hypothetical protein